MEESMTVDQPKKRPNFLLVLCILSFIGSGGFGIGGTLYNYLTFRGNYEQKMEQTQQAVDMMGDREGFFADMTRDSLNTMQVMAEKLDEITGVSVLFMLLSLIGVFMMFKLKKNGFYLYTFANCFALLVPMYYYGFGASAIMQIAMGGFFTILFVIMYATQLKHME